MTDSMALTVAPWPYLAVQLGLAALCAAVMINFILYRPDEGRRTFLRSPVDTFSMTVFGLLAAGLILSRWGTFNPGNLGPPLQVLGVLLLYSAVGVNILGRRWLGANWSDQIRIRETHVLVQKGIYRWIRHPLYASTIGILLGVGLVYANGLVLILTAAIFIPMMIFRARQEEAQLIQMFPEYADYRRRAGMFLPRLNTRRIP